MAETESVVINDPKGEPNAELRKYLTLLANLHGQQRLVAPRYTSLEALVLAEGVVGRITPATYTQPTVTQVRGPKGQCFRNAALLLQQQTQLGLGPLTYCEGYATCIIPTGHAWCLTREGAVVDPTWTNGQAYLGIPFDEDYLHSTISRRGCYGLLENPELKFPLLRANNPTYRHDHFPL